MPTFLVASGARSRRSMRHTNSHADCQPISNGHSYVYAYPDSSGHCYTYSASYGYTDR